MRSDRGHDELPIPNRRQRDEEDAVAELVEHVGRELERKAGLAGAARPDQREQPHVVAQEQRARLGQLALAADEGVRLRRQVRRPVVERRQRRELVRQAVELELVELLRPREVLQPVRAEVAQARVGVKQRLRRLRDEHLPAVADRHHPRGVVDVEPDVAPVGGMRLAGVEADSHADLVASRPIVLRQGTLSGGRGGNRVLRRSERDEEGVALAVHYDAAVPGEGLVEQGAVLGEQAGVGIADSAQQASRALDVREEQGDRAGR